MNRATCLSAFLIAFPLSVVAQTADELREQLKERDATIQELHKRIEALEKEKRAQKPSQAQAPVDADDDELNRALERTLVQRGGLVLRPHTYELEPQLAYSHWDPTRSSFHHELDSALAFRAGLPSDSQFQMRVPYVQVGTSMGSNTALGDIAFSLSKQLWREKNYYPGLVASLGWVTRTGSDGSDGAAPTGSGFNVLQAGLTAVKRHDPLVLFGGVSYATSMARDISGIRVEPAAIVGVRGGTILATSPDTSLNVGLNLGFAGATKVDGQSVPNTETTLGTLQIGMSMLLTRRTPLELSTDLRVSGDVPDFRLTATLPTRF